MATTAELWEKAVEEGINIEDYIVCDTLQSTLMIKRCIQNKNEAYIFDAKELTLGSTSRPIGKRSASTNCKKCEGFTCRKIISKEEIHAQVTQEKPKNIIWNTRILYKE